MADDAATDAREAAQQDTSPTADPPATADAATTRAPETPAPAAGGAEEQVAWWVPAWYVIACAVPFAMAFLLPVPLIMVLRSTRPPVSFTTAAWAGIGAGWVLWLVGSVAWLLAGAFFAEERRRSPEAVGWWHRTTRTWIVVVLVWGMAATLGIWAFYAVAGSVIGLDG